MSLAFPMRLQQNGLLRREDPVAAVLSLLQIMARTPAGSWAGCPAFGLRDLFENSRSRADVARLALQRINEVFAELGLEEFVVSEIARELSGSRGVDTYAITLERGAGRESITTSIAYES